MQLGQQVPVFAPSGIYWTGALAQNAGAFQRVALPDSIGAGRTARSRIKALSITSFDNLAWELWFWRSLGGVGASGQIAPSTDPANVNLEHFAGFWSFAATDGKQIGAANAFYYYIDGLDILYEDLEGGLTVPSPGQTPLVRQGQGALVQPSAFLNVTLVNRSAGAKTAGAVFKATFILEPTLGW